MSIYIGGPLNGSKQSLLFKKTHKKDYFNYQDIQTNVVTTYYKVKLKINDEVKIFWITKELLETDISKLVENYIEKELN